MFFNEEIASLFNLIQGKENSWLHNVAESTLVFALLVLFLVVMVSIFYRFPSFLVVPESISSGWLIIRITVYTVMTAIVLAVLLGLGWWFFVESGQDPDNVQYGMATLYTAFFGSAFLTPVFTVVLVWLSAKVKHHHTSDL